MEIWIYIWWQIFCNFISLCCKRIVLLCIICCAIHFVLDSSNLVITDYSHPKCCQTSWQISRKGTRSNARSFVVGGWPDETASALVVRHAGPRSSPPEDAQRAPRWDDPTQRTEVRPPLPRPPRSSLSGGALQRATEQTSWAEVWRSRLHLRQILAFTKSRSVLLIMYSILLYIFWELIEQKASEWIYICVFIDCVIFHLSCHEPNICGV